MALARQRFDSAAGRLVQALRANTREHQSRLNRVAPRLSLAPMRTAIANERRQLDVTGRRSLQALRRVVEMRRQRFDGMAKLLDSLSYKSVLRRGFALVRDDMGLPVHSAAEVKMGQGLAIEFADGSVKAREDSGPKQGSLF